MKIFWLIMAGAGVAVAAVFLLRGDFETAFVVAAIGMVAWFLNYRMQIKAKMIPEEPAEDERIEVEDLDEER